MTATQKRYKGDSNVYVDVASRGDEVLGLSVKYGVPPFLTIGALLIRFVVRSGTDQYSAFDHLTPRGYAGFTELDLPEGTPKNKFTGLRLNKFAVPVVSTPLSDSEFGKWSDEIGLWPVVAGWIKEQLEAEGFTLLLTPTEFVNFVRGLVVKQPTLILNFPDLTLVEKAPIKVLKPKADPSETTDDDEDPDEDDDEDEDTIN